MGKEIKLRKNSFISRNFLLNFKIASFTYVQLNLYYIENPWIWRWRIDADEESNDQDSKEYTTLENIVVKGGPGFDALPQEIIL